MKSTTLKIIGTASLGYLFALSSPLTLAQQPGGHDVSRKPARPNYVHLDNVVIVASPRGDKVASFNLKTRKSDLLRLAESNDKSDDILMNVTPVAGPGVVAFHLRGPKITRLAACDPITGALIPQDLREPADGVASPSVAKGVAAYVIGHHAYAFSSELKCWDVAELAKGHSESPIVGDGIAIVDAPGHIYTFSSQTGRWVHIDLKETFDSLEDEAKRPANP